MEAVLAPWGARHPGHTLIPYHPSAAHRQSSTLYSSDQGTALFPVAREAVGSAERVARCPGLRPGGLHARCAAAVRFLFIKSIISF